MRILKITSVTMINPGLAPPKNPKNGAPRGPPDVQKVLPPRIWPPGAIFDNKSNKETAVSGVPPKFENSGWADGRAFWSPPENPKNWNLQRSSRRSKTAFPQDLGSDGDFL